MRKELFNNSESKTKRIRKLNYEPFVYVFEQDLESILVSGKLRTRNHHVRRKRFMVISETDKSRVKQRRDHP